jgi:hypothetical protein
VTRADPASEVRRAGTSAPKRHHTRREDVAVCLFFVALAGWLTHGLWPHPGTRALALNPDDQALYEWWLAHGTRLFSADHGLVTSLITDRLNAPDGVNLLANTSVIALGVVFTPVTLLFGAPVSFALIVAGNLAGTAIAWYLLFTRTLKARWAESAAGAAVCGFGPAMISQSNGHLHMTAQWLVPAMVWCVVQIVRGRWRVGLLLGVLVAVQVFVGEEVLFLAALTLALVSIGYAACRPAFARRVLPGFALGMLAAVGVALVLLAYPLLMQFAGPQSVSGSPFRPAYFGADLASWPAFSPLSVLGSPDAASLASGPAEYNTFLGWPLLLVATGCAVALTVVGRHRALAAAGTLAALVLAALAYGTDGPYEVVKDVPVVDAALPTRFALPVLPLVATLLVLALDRARAVRQLRFVVPAVVAAALLPIVPAPLPTEARPPVPTFFSEGYWRDCVDPGDVLVPVPLPSSTYPEPMRWAAAADARFGLPQGFFIGPYGGGGKATMGTYPQPTAALLDRVAKTGARPAIGPAQVAQARSDLRFWGASCVVLARAPHGPELLATLTALLGTGTRVADAWVWRV